MKQIVFLNAKGGVGKSTTSILTACAFAHVGKRVGLVDSDVNQKTLSKGLSYLDSSGLIPDGIEIYNPDCTYDIIIYDTPGRLDATETQEAIELATNIFLVTSASPADLFTAQDTAKMLKSKGHHSKTRILYNKIRKGTTAAKSLGTASNLIGLDYLKNVLYLRACYENLFVKGWAGINKDHKYELADVVMEMIL